MTQQKQKKFNIPLCKPSFNASELTAVREVLDSGWVAHGPKNKEFESLLRDFFHVGEVILLNSCASALEAALVSSGITGEVIIPSFTMSATANAVVRAGATPVFCDVEWKTGNIDASLVEGLITKKTEAIMPVHFAGFPCDMDAIMSIAKKHGLRVIEDSAECIGGKWNGKFAGTFGDAGCFSFWATKNITTGEGGMVTTNDTKLADKMRRFRNHGIDSDHRQRAELGTWYYEMADLGYNYRITDIQCALGLSQLRKLPDRLIRRQEIAQRYNKAFSGIPGIRPLTLVPEVYHAYHLYVISYCPRGSNTSRGDLFVKLHEKGIGANIHYIPVHLHPFYQKRFGYQKGDYPKAEKAYEQIISLPIYPRMDERDIRRVIETVTRIAEVYAA